MFVRVRSRGKSGCVAAALALAALGACAPKQHFSLDSCVDEKVVVYVDGRLLEGSPGDLALRSDQPHTLYVKRAGEAPLLVVLKSDKDGDSRPRLEPADPCAELVAIGLGRELTIEVEDEGAKPEPAQTGAPTPAQTPVPAP